jgi:hypothetical protein
MKCEHANCTCDSEGPYCSAPCEAAGETRGLESCACGHPGCAATERVEPPQMEPDIR